MYFAIAITIIYVTLLNAFILVDAGIQLLGIRNLIRKDTETQHENSRNFVLTAAAMILLFLAKLVEIYFSMFALSFYVSYGYTFLIGTTLSNILMITTQLIILYFAWSISGRPSGQVD